MSKEKERDMSIEEYYSESKRGLDIKKHLHKINKTLSKAEKVIEYKLITNDISIETGELTPSLKICRNKIEMIYKNEIESMY
jgi:long-chain acyl-CoA synthetase